MSESNHPSGVPCAGSGRNASKYTSSNSSNSDRQSSGSLTTPLIDLEKYRIPVQNTFIHFKFGMEGSESIGNLDGIEKRSRSVDSGSRRNPSDCGSVSGSSRSSGVEPVSKETIASHEATATDVPLPPGNWSLPNGAPLGSVDTAGLSSWGAAGHDQGTCSPCAWHWKPSGCSNGRQCTFCHTCDADEIFRRRRGRDSELKNEKRLLKESMGVADKAPPGSHIRPPNVKGKSSKKLSL